MRRRYCKLFNLKNCFEKFEIVEDKHKNEHLKLIRTVESVSSSQEIPECNTIEYFNLAEASYNAYYQKHFGYEHKFVGSELACKHCNLLISDHLKQLGMYSHLYSNCTNGAAFVEWANNAELPESANKNNRFIVDCNKQISSYLTKSFMSADNFYECKLTLLDFNECQNYEIHLSLGL